MPEAVIVEAVRTPIGRNRGKLKDWWAADLLAAIFNELLARTKIDPAVVDDVIVGCVTQTGEQGLNIARIATLVSDLPVSVPGSSINRACGSGQWSITHAAEAIMAGTNDVIIAGGVESMSRVTLLSDAGDPAGMKSYTRKFGLIPQGISAELMAEKWGLTREEIDRFSFDSHQKAIRATDEGRFKDEILPLKVNGEMMTQDEGIRRDTSIEKLTKLRPAFKEDGMITAGSSSQISDGAAALMITSPEKADELGLRPRARLKSFATTGVDPMLMLTGPITSTPKALTRAGLTLDDMDLIEVNEAFASVPLAFIKELEPKLETINVNGGAIALGHPVGSTGSRLLTSILYEMERRKSRYGLVTMCCGLGIGTATILELCS